MTDASQTVRSAVETIAAKKSIRGTLRAFSDRFGKLGFDLMLTAACLVPGAREYLDREIRRAWSEAPSVLSQSLMQGQDIIIGSGPHAAIYAAIRRQTTGIKPFVIERSNRPGGVFAITENPAWFLNSANRPGNGIGRPGNNGQTNYMPGATVQMSDLGMAEYQPNTDLAFITRLSLAQNARVFPSTLIERIDPDSEYVVIDGVRFYAYNSRIIVATGLGNESYSSAKPPIYSFSDYMRRLDSPFPLRDWQRVAVIGDGDGAKVVVESLLGIGPAMPMTMASMDNVETIDWYGTNIPQNKAGWRDRERSRYLRIGKYLSNGRVTVVPQRGYPAATGPKSVMVGNRNYDAAVVCTGYSGGLASDLYDDYSFEHYAPQFRSQTIARKADGREVYVIGPAANLSYTFAETSTEEYAQFPANVNALFRYAGKTAALAAIP